MAIWDPDNKLSSLAQETQFNDGNLQEAAKRIFEENAIMAAHSICHIALYDENSKLRLDASKYVIERNLGKIGDPLAGDGEDAFDAFLKDVVKSS